MFSSWVERQLTLSPTTAAGRSLARMGAASGFAGAGAPSSLLGCTPERGAILAARLGCQDGNGCCRPWGQPQPCSPGGSHPTTSRVGALRAILLLGAGRIACIFCVGCDVDAGKVICCGFLFYYRLLQD
uniref:Uncharacterized protein n=1 Tax=mine drainage metagenome TaxID=410659 RepID=E6QQ39_9ZZZZ